MAYIGIVPYVIAEYPRLKKAGSEKEIPMPFIKRDADGKIETILHRPVEGASEKADIKKPELIRFLLEAQLEDVANRDFIASDLALSRVLEDLIDLLIENGTFQFSSLPKAAQEKLMARRGLRREFAYVDELFSPEEDEIVPDEDSDGGGFL